MNYQTGSDFTLEKDGVCVIENVISKKDILMLREKMWEYLHHLTLDTATPIEKHNPSTYRAFFELIPKHGMLLQHWSVGHNPMSWNVRQNPNVIGAFKNIWGTDDLLTSFDGLSISLPCEDTRRGWHRNNTWFHSDQSFTRNDFECVQGFINLYDVKEGDATLRVLTGSHNLHKQCGEHFSLKEKHDWHVLNEAQLNYYKDNDCKDTCLLADAGSLVLWDSRTIHQGIEPQKSRAHKNIRCVLYVCMTPRGKATKAQLTKKQKAFTERRSTSHWPHKIKLFPYLPRSYGNRVPKVENFPIEETLLMRKLAGF